MLSSTARGHWAMAAASVMWGLMSPVCKGIVLSGISPTALATMRMTGAAALFWLASCFLPREKVRRSDRLPLLLAGICGVALNQGAFTFGVGLTIPSDAALAATTLPIITLILSRLFLREQLDWRRMAGIAFGASGATLLIASSAHGEGEGHVAGTLLCLFAQVSAACYFVFFRRQIARYSPVTLMKWMFLVAAVCASPFAGISWKELPAQAMNTAVWSGIAYVVVAATFLCYILMPIAQRALRPTTVSLYNYLQPIIATTVATLWGMEIFTPWKALSMAMIFAGVFLAAISPVHRRPAVDTA